MFKKFMMFGLPSMLFLIFFMALLSCSSSSGGDSVAVATMESTKFCPPLFTTKFCERYNSTSVYSVTSPFGSRLDPLGSGTNKFHTGIDLGAPAGTPIYASSDGVIHEVGFSESGLGNYVYIMHETELGTLYTGYGHMLDDSILVEKGQIITAGTQIGSVGSTGTSTGNHLHFMIMKGKISFNQKDLINPNYIIYGLK